MTLLTECGVTFEATTHTYRHEGRVLMSCSSIIKRFAPVFDPTGEILARCAAMDGQTVDDKRAEWATKRDVSCAVGKQFHAAAERWLIAKEPNSRFDDIFAIMARWKFRGQLHTEQILHDVESGIAGTTDLGELEGRTVHLFDFKTNQDLDEDNKYRSFMLPPIEHHPATPLGKYQLQLNIYMWMLRRHGFIMGNMWIWHVDLTARTVKSHRVPVLQVEVQQMLSAMAEEAK